MYTEGLLWNPDQQYSENETSEDNTPEEEGAVSFREINENLSRQLVDLESAAGSITEQVGLISKQLQEKLREVSVMTVQYLNVYYSSAVDTQKCVHQAVVNMQAFIDRCYQLNDELTDIEPLALQIKDILRCLDILETSVNKALKAKK
mmetsp:Transcript_16176/g.41538  ORF Transcript_16176/g.41538 Transcript_16176/m.41538 type:complete len:148 (+) Transcript_16176:87-530(+)